MTDPLDTALSALRQAAGELRYDVSATATGTVVEVGDGIVRFAGLREVGYLEVIQFENDGTGLVMQLEDDLGSALVLGADERLTTGSQVWRTGVPLQVPVGPALRGRVISPMGQPLDGRPLAADGPLLPVEAPSPRIVDRQPVDRPLVTGTKVIDALFPIGRGQRELILGDRGTGKSTLAIDAVIAQRREGVRCVYCCIGQKASFTAQLLQRLDEGGALDGTTVVVATSADAPALRYLAPYAACAIAEAERDSGGDALVIFDDLSKHADAYRELSLLLGRPPSREAYPADVFYAHARLLERAANLKDDGGSVSALPIVETLAGNIAAYIPTNLISITDGQLYLDRKRFNAGIFPAIDIGLSVSRVGSKAQRPLMRHLSHRMKLDLSQYEELEAYVRFGADLDERTQRQLDRGRRTIEALKQAPYAPWTTGETIVLLHALEQGMLDAVPMDRVAAVVAGLRSEAARTAPELLDALTAADTMDGELQVRLEAFLHATLPPLVGKPGDADG